MEFKLKYDKGVAVISLSGKMIGGPDALELNRQLHALLTQGKKKVVVDLGKVDLMNSSGLGMLISGLTSVRNAGGDLKLADVPAKILDLISITKLSKVFDHWKSVKDAVESFQ
jgi:anti-sigma B factor antagonist